MAPRSQGVLLPLHVAKGNGIMRLILTDNARRGARIHQREERLQRAVGRLCQFLLLVMPQLGLHAQLGGIWLTTCIAVVALLIVFKLATFPRWGDELPHVGKFVRGVAFLIAIVTIENFLTWATSASDQHKYEYTPLQDNVEIATLWAFERLPLFKMVVMGWRVDMHFLLYCFVSLCLSVMWDQVPYSGFGMGCRFVDTIAWAHAIRTVAFMITVLPNPRPNCYRDSFAPVPTGWWEFVAYGFSAKRGHGCNDLVISGHGCVYTAVPLALSTFYPLRIQRGGASLLAWLAVAKLCLQEAVDKTHYSVDMFLAVVVTSLVWHWRSGLYPATPDNMWKQRSSTVPPDPVPYRLVALVAGVLLLVFVGVAGT